MNIKNAIFNPFAKTGHGIKDFKTLHHRERVLTIVATALAALACSPFFIIGGICAGTATFRLLSEKFAKARIVVVPPQSNPQPVEEVFPEKEFQGFDLPIPFKPVKPVINWLFKNDELILFMDQGGSDLLRRFKENHKLELCLDLKTYKMNFSNGNTGFRIPASIAMPTKMINVLKRHYKGPSNIRLYIHWTPDTNRPFFKLNLKGLRPEDGYVVFSN